MIKNYKNVVVGSGPGGALTAALLAEAGKDVLLLEKGSYYPLNTSSQFTQIDFFNKYKNRGLTFANGPTKVLYIEGECVGGGSEINSGLYHRTPSEIITSWKKNFMLEDFDEKNLLAFFQQNEIELNVSFMPKELIPRASLKLHNGASALGWKSIEVPRWVKYHNQNQVKQSMTETFIPRAIEAGAQLSPDVYIKKIIPHLNKWYLEGAKKKSHNIFEKFSIFSENIFLCLGAVATADIIKRNGLKKNAGKTLYMHPTLKLVGRFSEDVNSQDMGVPVHQIKEFSPNYSMGCSISSPLYLHMAMKDLPGGHELVNNYWSKMAIYYVMTPEGSGSIHQIPFSESPYICYKVNKLGFISLKEGLFNLGKCLFESGAIEIYPVADNSQAIKNLRELRDFVDKLTLRRLDLMTIHLFSSCPMGENKNNSITNSFGKVHDFEGLFINDSSLLPTAPTVNPQGTLMMIARRNINHYLSSGN